MNKRMTTAVSTAVVTALGAAATVAPGLLTATDAATEVRHYLDADQFGGTSYEGAEAVDGGGRIIATAGITLGELPGQTGAGGSDAFVRADTRNLGETWTAQVGTAEDDFGFAVATNGSVVAAGGATEGDLGGPGEGLYDAWLRLYDGDGSVLWTRQFGGTDHDYLRDLEVSSDAVYATGTIGDHGFVRKYSLAGALQWEADVTADFASDLLLLKDHVYYAENHIGSLEDRADLVALDAGTGLVAWRTDGLRNVDPKAVVTDGKRLYFVSWYYGTRVHVYDQTGKHLAKFSHALDASTAAWDGTSLVTVSWVYDDVYQLTALSPDGRERWTQRLPADVEPTDVTFHPAGNFDPAALYVAGIARGSSTGTQAGEGDAVVARYVTYQPDAKASMGRRTVGNDRYGARHQRLVIEISRGQRRTALLYAQNDGEVEQTLVLGGCPSQDGFRIRYLSGDEDISSQVNGAGLPIDELRHGDAGLIDLTVSLRPRSKDRTICPITVTSATTGESDRVLLDLRRR